MIDNKIHQYIQKERSKPFVWGSRDCNTFVLNFIDSIYNLDLESILIEFNGKMLNG